MQAIRIHQFGGPEVLKLETLPDPRPTAGEVLVDIRASSVNPVDYKIRQGGYLAEDQLPMTLGRDVAGVVAACGAGVTVFNPGDAVFALLPMDRGGYAERVTAPSEIFARKPERLDFIEAAGVPLAAMTAWQGLFDQGGLSAGQTVLIHGAGGGVGHLAVQFAKTKGAEVFATCSAEDLDFVRKLGADHVIDYKAQRFEDAAHDLDLVYDLIGGETQTRSFAVLKRGGRLVSTLTAPDPEACAAAGVRGAHYHAQPDAGELSEIAGMIDAGAVAVTVAKTFPLAQAAQAEAWLEHEHVQGKVVLTVH